MLGNFVVQPSDRIPGFAICARCGVRRQLAPCGRCGLLVCGDCRGERRCAVCHFERLAAERRAHRRERLRETGRRAAVIALIAASGATGIGAAFLPDGPLAVAAVGPATPVELHLVPASPTEPPVLRTAAPGAWPQPITFRCFDVGDGVTCCVLGR
jgi:hypothetical protein